MTEKKMQLVDWLDDLCVRFIINLPQEELESVERICFQIEEAQWFYEDFIRPADPSLPQLGLSEFASRLMKHCPLTAGYSNDLHALAFKQFMAYKTRVPVRGAILLDEDMDKVLLVKGYKKNATWSFPRGKINKDEDDLVCAIREVWEETGYDIEAAGLVPKDRNVHCIDVTMREQHLRMFVFRSVPLDTPFEPQTRKEISKIQWYKLSTLPTYSNNKKRSQHVIDTGDADNISASKLYMVAPFLHSLKKWINQQKKLDAHRTAQLDADSPALRPVSIDAPLDQDPPAQSLHVEVLRAAEDPANELKRLLALGSTATQTPSVPSQTAAVVSESVEGHQADALMAMLRGSSTGLAQTSLPKTPMEQLIGNPNQPQSPHVQHVKASPHTTQMPPPEFPLSPNRHFMQDTNRAFGQLNMNGQTNMHQESMPFTAHPQQQFPSIPQPQIHGPQFGPNHPMQRYLQQQQHQHQQHQQHQHHSQATHQAAASLQPQGHGAIAHGPAAPKASQLPPPNMNSHTMNLLNAFKSPSLDHRSVHAQRPLQRAALDTPVQHHGHMSIAGAQNNIGTTSNRNLHPGYQQPQHEAPSQSGPPKSQHQKSLLDLFKSPTTQQATLAEADSQSQQRAVSVQVNPTPFTSNTGIAIQASEPVKQRNSTVAMMTRTLPKAKTSSPMATHPGSGGGETVASLFPAKEVVRQVQASSFDRSVPDGSQPNGAGDSPGKAPFKILSRPGVTSVPKASPIPPRNVAPSPRKDRASRAIQSNSGQNFTILQRPSPTKQQGSATQTLPIPSGSPAHAQGSTKSFQPQLLRRPKGAEADATNTQPTNPASQALGSGDQRDTLLALFAKSGQGRSKSIDPVASRMGPASSGSASPLPLDPAAFRSRIASNASGISNGDGLKSPVTPVETKGFLMDYLNGVVKGEHHRSAKRPQ